MTSRLRADLEAARQFYNQPGSLVNDLELEDDTINFQLGSPSKRQSLSLFCTDYPGSCTMYTEDGEPKEYSGKLLTILTSIVAEYCKKHGTPNPISCEGETNKLRRSAETNSKQKQRKKTTVSSEEEEEEDEDIEFNSEDESGEAMSEALKEDMELVKKVYGSRCLTTRDFSTIDTIDVELHLDVHFLGASVGDAWGVDRSKPITCRLTMSASQYLTASSVPKIEVFQNSSQKFGLQSQLSQIILTFVKDQWKVPDTKRMSVNEAEQLSQGKGKHKIEDPPSPVSVVEAVDEEHDRAVASIMEMGFSFEMATIGAEHTTNVEAAVEYLLSNPTAPSGKRKAKVAAAKKPAKRASPSKGKDLESNNPLEHWEETFSEHAKQNIPPRRHGFLVQVLEYLKGRIPTLSNYCVICDHPHLFSNGAMLKPAVCSRELCCFAFQKLGVMADAADDIATEAEVVDLLICMATAAANSNRCNDIFDPFPTVFDPDNPKHAVLSPAHKDFDRVRNILTSLPAVRQLAQAKDCIDMKQQLEKSNKYAYPLLQWLIASNRSHIVKLAAHKHIRSMTTQYQYVLLSSPPEKEEKFRLLKEEHGSVFAFHGSRVENWHAILRVGLRNASGTKLQINGAAHGAGIYMSPHSATSFGYSMMNHHAGFRGGSRKHTPSDYQDTRQGSGDNRFLNSSNFFCIALCEVINHSTVRKSGSIWVCPNEDFVVTRFFFVYDQGNVAGHPNVDTADSTFLEQVHNALDRSS